MPQNERICASLPLRKEKSPNNCFSVLGQAMRIDLLTVCAAQPLCNCVSAKALAGALVNPAL